MKKYVLCILLGVCSCSCFAQNKVDLSRYVDPFIGTSDDHGQTNPAAVVPFGMIKAGPDTKPAGQSGYNYLATEIKGFSQSRISGVGCNGAGGNLRILPFIGSVKATESINKSKERAAVGYYSVELLNGVKVEITTDRTAAIYRFSYPKAKAAGLNLDLRSAFAKFHGEEHKVVSKNAVKGFVQSACTCDFGSYKFYYYIQIDKPDLSVSEDEGKIYWNFNTAKDETIIVKVGLSSVSEDHAKQNLTAEVGHKTFEQVRQSAIDSWNNILNVVKVETADENLKKSFYTRLYHASLNPSNIKDNSSTYRGSDGEVYSSDRDHYHGWSIWDTFRTRDPLFSIIYPDQYKDMIYALIKLYKQGKPAWATTTEPFPTVRTEHAAILILDALNKRLVRPDLVELIFNELIDEVNGLEGDAPDKILESCYDYWAVSEIAKHLGLPAIQKQYADRSKEYRTVWRQKFKVMDQKSDIMHGDGLYEGTLWQYRWFVPYDMHWIVKELGSREKAVAELDYFFANNLFNMGNQPDIQTPYLHYAFGEPWKSQKIVHDILMESTTNHYGTHDKWKQPYIGKIFKTAPEGYLKEMDDDAGTMSSWYVLSTIGLYPVCPGLPDFWLSVPAFDALTIRVGKNRDLKIKVARESKNDLYIQSVSLNGADRFKNWLSYDEIMNGGELIIKMGLLPNKNWGNK